MVLEMYSKDVVDVVAHLQQMHALAKDVSRSVTPEGLKTGLDELEHGVGIVNNVVTSLCYRVGLQIQASHDKKADR